MNNTAILGYTPLSAVNRIIKDGSRFDKLFPQPDGRKTLLKKDGEVEETVQFMKQIVNDNSWQTEKIAEKIADYNSDGSINQKESVRKLWQFVVDYIKYNIESGEQLRTPAKTWYDAQVMARKNPSSKDPKYSADCDCMSIFCGCVLLNWGIPFSFRITGYSDTLGFCRGYQHVYTIAHCAGEDVICDPVYHMFNKEKQYEIQNTIPMSLNGCDIYALSGLAEDVENMNVYVEQPDGSLGELNGRKKRKKRRAERKKKKKARKEARKEKRKAKKEKRKAKRALRKAKRKGDKKAEAAAKERLTNAKKKIAEAKVKIMEAKDKIDANRVGIAKFVSKAFNVIKKGTMLAVRAPFLLLMRVNFRGMATQFAKHPEAMKLMKKRWRRTFGGNEKKLEKAINKGKDKKALFGKGKGVSGLGALSLKYELKNLGDVLERKGIITRQTLKHEGLGFADGGVGEAMALASSVIAVATGVLETVKALVPANKEEAEAQGMEAEEVDSDTKINYDKDDIDEGDSSESSEQSTEESEESEESEEELEGLSGLYGDFYYIGDDDEIYHKKRNGKITVLGELNGKKRAARKAKKAKKRKAKKAKKKQKKQAKKQKRKQKRQERKQKRKAKKAKKKADNAVEFDDSMISQQTNFDADQAVELDNTTTRTPDSAEFTSELQNMGMKTETIEISDEMAQKIANVAAQAKFATANKTETPKIPTSQSVIEKNEEQEDTELPEEPEESEVPETNTKITSIGKRTTDATKEDKKKGVGTKILLGVLGVALVGGVAFAIHKATKKGGENGKEK